LDAKAGARDKNIVENYGPHKNKSAAGPPAGHCSRGVFIFFMALAAALFCFISVIPSYARQPIVADGETPRPATVKEKSYENNFYGFAVSYPPDFELSVKRGGAVTIIPKKTGIYRFVPALVISKYFVIKGQALKTVIGHIEKKMSALPYYRLNYIKDGALTSEVRVCREFVDEASEETVYEVSLYKIRSEDLFEISWQVPRSHSNSALADTFGRIAASFKALDRQGTAEVMAGAPVNTPAQILSEAASLIAAGRNLDALALLKKAAKAGPLTSDIHLLTARCYTNLKDYKRAASAYEELLKLSPANLEFLNLYADSLILCKEYKKALKQCKKALELTGPPDAMAMAYINLGNVFLDTGMLNESLNSYIEGTTKFPSSARLYNNAAYVYFLQRDYNSASEYYNKAIYLDAGNKNAHLGIARVYMLKPDHTAAVFHYNKAMALDADCEEAYAGLLNIYKAAKQDKKYAELLSALRSRSGALYDRVVKKVK
jgi:tetratricopeptide (TPR) repeat protein